LTQRIRGYEEESYYRMMDGPMYHDFAFIGRELGDYRMAVMDPYMAWTLPPVAGKPVWSAEVAPSYIDRLTVLEFFEGGGRNTRWLLDRGIDIIYTRYPLDNPDLVEVREGLYILRKEAWKGKE
jgi:hypothetical protein